jgi:hypothetical protein
MSLYVGDRLVCRFGWNCRSIQTCTLDGHLLVHRVTYTRYRINTIDSPDDEHRGARNISRIRINIYEKELCVKLVINKNLTEMHGQRNIKVLEIYK